MATCPNCGGKPATAEEGRRFFPFCSERCKMADLGHWFSEDYRISRPIQEEDLLGQEGDEQAPD